MLVAVLSLANTVARGRLKAVHHGRCLSLQHEVQRSPQLLSTDGELGSSWTIDGMSRRTLRQFDQRGWADTLRHMEQPAPCIFTQVYYYCLFVHLVIDLQLFNNWPKDYIIQCHLDKTLKVISNYKIKL